MLIFLFFQAGTHHLKRMDKELLPLCTGNMSESSCFLWNIFPLSDWLGIYHLSHGNHLVGSFDKYSRHPAPGKTLFRSHFASPPQCFSEEDDVRLSLVLFSKYAHLSFENKELFSLEILGKCFFFSCSDKAGFTVHYPSLNGNFKRRLIQKRHLITTAFVFFFLFPFVSFF